IRSGLKEGGTFIVPGGEPLIDEHLPSSPGPAAIRVIRFGESEDCDIRLLSVELSHQITRFRIHGTPQDYQIPMLGRHNANNALAAIAVGHIFGVPEEQIAEGLSGF